MLNNNSIPYLDKVEEYPEAFNPSPLENGSYSASISTAPDLTSKLELCGEEVLSQYAFGAPRASANFIEPIRTTLENMGAIEPKDLTANLVKYKLQRLISAERKSFSRYQSLVYTYTNWMKSIKDENAKNVIGSVLGTLNMECRNLETLIQAQEQMGLSLKLIGERERQRDNDLLKIEKIKKERDQERRKKNDPSRQRNYHEDIARLSATWEQSDRHVYVAVNQDLRDSILNYALSARKQLDEINKQIESYFSAHHQYDRSKFSNASSYDLKNNESKIFESPKVTELNDKDNQCKSKKTRMAMTRSNHFVNQNSIHHLKPNGNEKPNMENSKNLNRPNTIENNRNLAFTDSSDDENLEEIGEESKKPRIYYKNVGASSHGIHLADKSQMINKIFEDTSISPEDVWG